MKFYGGGAAIRWIWITCLCVVVWGIANGQHTPTKNAASTQGSLSGRVFAITEGGDLKPARMADVYILYQSGATRDGKAVDVGETADLVFMEAHNEAQEQYLKDFQANSQWSEKTACMKDLETFRPAIIKAMEWAQVHSKQSQIAKTQTDEEGNFSASLPAGKYDVYVRGRAGFNESLWDTGIYNVTIQPGAHVVLKLSSPEKSCLDVPD
jgi:hypothetical protein